MRNEIQIERQFVASRSLALLLSLFGGGKREEDGKAGFSQDESSYRHFLGMVLFHRMSVLCERITAEFISQLLISIRPRRRVETIRSTTPCGIPSVRETFRARGKGDSVGYWQRPGERETSAEAELVLLTLEEIVRMARFFDSWRREIQDRMKHHRYKLAIRRLARPIYIAAAACGKARVDELLSPARPMVTKYANHRMLRLAAVLKRNVHQCESLEYRRYVSTLVAQTSSYHVLGDFLKWRHDLDAAIRSIVAARHGIQSSTLKKDDWLYEVWVLSELMAALKRGGAAVHMIGCLGVKTSYPVFAVNAGLYVFHECQPQKQGTWIRVGQPGAFRNVPQRRFPLSEAESGDILVSDGDGNSLVAIDCKLIGDDTKSEHRLCVLGYMRLLHCRFGLLCTPRLPSKGALIRPRPKCGGRILICTDEEAVSVYAEACVIPRRDAHSQNMEIFDEVALIILDGLPST